MANDRDRPRSIAAQVATNVIEQLGLGDQMRHFAGGVYQRPKKTRSFFGLKTSSAYKRAKKAIKSFQQEKGLTGNWRTAIEDYAQAQQFGAEQIQERQAETLARIKAERKPTAGARIGRKPIRQVIGGGSRPKFRPEDGSPRTGANV